MIAHSKPRRKKKSDCVEAVPSPQEVRAMAAEIRQSWSPRERHRRALLARWAALGQLLGGGW
jgi:hypothetical protein